MLRVPVFTALFLALFVSRLAHAAPLREKLPFDADWRFQKGDPDNTGDALSYTTLKPYLNATGNEFRSDNGQLWGFGLRVILAPMFRMSSPNSMTRSGAI